MLGWSLRVWLLNLCWFPVCLGSKDGGQLCRTHCYSPVPCTNDTSCCDAEKCNVTPPDTSTAVALLAESSWNSAATSPGKNTMMQRCNAEAGTGWVSSLISVELLTQFESMILWYIEKWIKLVYWYGFPYWKIRMDFHCWIVWFSIAQMRSRQTTFAQVSLITQLSGPNCLIIPKYYSMKWHCLKSKSLWHYIDKFGKTQCRVRQI